MSNKIITLDHLTTYDGKIKKYIADNSDAVTGEINEQITAIYEKLEGKKSTYLLDCTWDLDYFKPIINEGGIKVEDANGTDISEAILNGSYQVNTQNNLFDSNDEEVLTTDAVLIVVKPDNDNSVIIIDNYSNIFELGDIVLVIQPNVPDRWYVGAGSGFYALETQKIEVPVKTSDLTNDSGFITGPASSTNNAIAIYDGTTGKTIKNSDITINTYGTSSSSSRQYVNIAAHTGASIKLYDAIAGDGVVLSSTGSGGGSVAWGWNNGSGKYFAPGFNNNADLGISSSRMWRHLYLAGNLSDGMNSITIADIASKQYVDTAIENTYNIENGTGTNALQMKQDGDSGVFTFTDKNPNATALDSTLTGDITYGATGNFATVLGGKNAAMGKRSLAQGTTTIAKGNYSHAEGDNSVALGGDSHAEGYATVASGTASHSEGTSTQATAEAAHSEGAYTIASGLGSHAEGNHSQATGVHAHAEGNGTIASGPYTHTNGSETRAGYQDQFVAGRFNNNKSNTLFEIGCGNSDSERRNAFEVYQNGDIAIDGTTLYTSKEYLNLQSTSIAGRGGSIRIETSISSSGTEAHLYPIVSGPNEGGFAYLGTSDHPWTKFTLSGDLSDGTNSITISEIVNNKSNATNLKNGRETTISVQGGTDNIANYDGDIVFGTGLESTTENQAVFGSYNAVDWDYTNGRPLLTVGNGTADSKHTAFEVYNNNSIKIGDTIITEEQLKKLLALLDAMETVTVEE